MIMHVKKYRCVVVNCILTFFTATVSSTKFNINITTSCTSFARGRNEGFGCIIGVLGVILKDVMFYFKIRVIGM